MSIEPHVSPILAPIRQGAFRSHADSMLPWHDTTHSVDGFPRMLAESTLMYSLTSCPHTRPPLLISHLKTQGTFVHAYSGSPSRRIASPQMRILTNRSSVTNRHSTVSIGNSQPLIPKHEPSQPCHHKPSSPATTISLNVAQSTAVCRIAFRTQSFLPLLKPAQGMSGSPNRLSTHFWFFIS